MISSSQLSSASAVVAYHADAFDASITREGAQYELTPSQWGGLGAAAAGFTAGQPVRREDFEDVLNGRVGDQVLAGGWSRELGGRHHKAGMDFTFSPGKSVSLTALLPGGDRRIIAAHSAAVSEAMRYLEHNGAQARMSRDRVRTSEPTYNLLYAKFQHTTSRDLDPQLHTHVVIANATYDTAGETWRALANKELLNLRKSADQVYGQALEGHLRQLGYRTIEGKSGPEIAGYSPDQLAAFSGRTADMASYLAAKGLSIDTASPAQRQVANFATREDKAHLPREQLESAWAAKAQAVGLDISVIVPRSPEPARVQVTAVPQVAVDHMVDHLIDKMVAAKDRVTALTTAYHDARRVGETDHLHRLARDLKAARLDLAAVTPGQIGQRVREAGHAGATAEQVQAALEKAVSAGRLHEHDGKVSVETRDELSRRTAMDAAAERAYRRADVAAAVDRLIERLTERRGAVQALTDQLAAAHAAGEPTKSMVADLRTASRHTETTQAQVINQARQQVPHATKADVTSALDAAVASGRLHKHSVEGREGTRQILSPEPAEDMQARKALTTAAFRAERAQTTDTMVATASAALDKLIDRMEHARDQVAEISAELQFARSQRNDRRIDQLTSQLRSAQRELAGMSEGQLERAIRDTLNPARPTPAATPTDTVPRDLADDRLSRLEAYAASLGATSTARGAEAAKAAGVDIEQATKAVAAAIEKAFAPGQNAYHTRASLGMPSTNPTPERTTPLVSSGAIRIAIDQAIQDGRLHRNVDRISVETEQQTTARQAADRAGSQGYRAEQRDAKTAERKAAYKDRIAARKAEIKDEMTARRSEYLKTLSPQQRSAVENPTLHKAVRAIKTAAFVASHPSAAARYYTKQAAKSIGRTALKTLGTAANALGEGFKVGVTVLVDKGTATRDVQAETAKLTAKHDVTRISTLGYRQTGAGEIQRAKLTVRNAVLMTAAAALKTTAVLKLAETADRKLAGMSADATRAGNIGKALAVSALRVPLRLAVAASLASQAARNAVVADIKLTKVSAPEALLAKAVASVAKQIGHGVRVAGDAAVRGIERRTREHEIGAIKNYLKAEQGYLAGKLTKGDFQIAHDKAARAIESAKSSSRAAYSDVATRADKLIASARKIDAKMLPDAQRRLEDKTQQLDRVLPGAERLDKVIALTTELRERVDTLRDMRAAHKIGLADTKDVTAAKAAVDAVKERLQALRPSYDDAKARVDMLGLSSTRELKLVERDAKASVAAMPEKAARQTPNQIVERVQVRAEQPGKDRLTDPMPEKSIAAGNNFHNQQEKIMDDKRDRLIAPTERERNAAKDAGDALIKKVRAQEQTQDAKAGRNADKGVEPETSKKPAREAGMGW